MTLYNRDGSIFRLRGPNPMMKGQETWDGFQVHNMIFPPDVAQDEREITALESDFNLKNDFAQELAETRPDISVVEQPAVAKPVEEKISQPLPEVKPEELARFIPEPEQPRQKSTIPDKNKTFIHCLPATLRGARTVYTATNDKRFSTANHSRSRELSSARKTCVSLSGLMEQK